MTYLLFSLLFVGALSAPDNLSNDNLLIEHSVSTDSANNAIQHLVPDLMIGAGCKECTRREIEYCLSNSVIEDHCCCQGKFHAHKCYVKSRNCEPTVRDCGVFDRLLSCCCHRYLGIKWKNQLSTTNSINGQSKNNKYILYINGLLIILLINIHYYIFNS